MGYKIFQDDFVPPDLPIFMETRREDGNPYPPSEIAVTIGGSEPRLRFNDSLDRFGAGSGAAGQTVAEAVGSSLSSSSRTLMNTFSIMLI